VNAGVVVTRVRRVFKRKLGPRLYGWAPLVRPLRATTLIPRFRGTLRAPWGGDMAETASIPRTRREEWMRTTGAPLHGPRPEPRGLEEYVGKSAVSPLLRSQFYARDHELARQAREARSGKRPRRSPPTKGVRSQFRD